MCVASVVYLNNSVYVIWISRQFFFLLSSFWLDELFNQIMASKMKRHLWFIICNFQHIEFKTCTYLYSFYCDGTIVLGFSTVLLLTRLDFFILFNNQTIKISIWLSDPPTPLIDMTAMIGFSEMDLDPRKEEETIANHI